jgi:hypothetical protein
MCVTKELKHMVCLHIDTHKKECIHKPGSFLGCLIACSPKTRSASEYGLCHECRRTWAIHGLDEQQAIRAYQNYRNTHDYEGPLSPCYIFAEDPPTLKEDKNAGGESSQAIQPTMNISGPKIDRMQDITSLLYGGAATSRRSSIASTETHWPIADSVQKNFIDSVVSQTRKRKGKEKEVERDATGLRWPNSQGVIFLVEDDGKPPQWV